jgi:hypothetical protein
MKFKLKGLKSVERKIQNLERDSQKAINKGIQQTARLILNSALSRVPTKMGDLKASLGIENIPEEMTSKVYASALYSAFVEFGTGAFVEVPIGLEEYAMQWFETGEGRGHPKPFLFNSMADHQEKLLPLIEQELKKLLNK